MTRAAVTCVLSLAGLIAGCGGTTTVRSADEIAKSLGSAVNDVKPKPGLTVGEEAAESGAIRATCEALDAYSANPSQDLSMYIQRYAERQRTVAGFNLGEIDPDAADSLASAAAGINDSQQAVEVAGLFGCG